MDFSFLDLRCKEVINLVDGKRLGNIVDVVLNLSDCKVLGFVVPMIKKGFNLFKSQNDIFIPINQVVKIGDDAILVELFGISAPGDGRIASLSASKTQPDDSTQKN